MSSRVSFVSQRGDDVGWVRNGAGERGASTERLKSRFRFGDVSPRHRGCQSESIRSGYRLARRNCPEEFPKSLNAEACNRGGCLSRGSHTKTAALLFLQKNIEERVVNPNLAVIFDEAQFSEAIHKKTHSRSCCANHLSQYLLADPGNHRLGFAFFAKLGEQ